MIVWVLWMLCIAGGVYYMTSREEGPMTEAQARKIAQNSKCQKEWILTKESRSDDEDRNFRMNAGKSGCAAECRINKKTKQVDIAWRCTWALLGNQEEYEKIPKDNSYEIAKKKRERLLNNTYRYLDNDNFVISKEKNKKYNTHTICPKKMKMKEECMTVIQYPWTIRQYVRGIDWNEPKNLPDYIPEDQRIKGKITRWPYYQGESTIFAYKYTNGTLITEVHPTWIWLHQGEYDYLDILKNINIRK